MGSIPIGGTKIGIAIRPAILFYTRSWYLLFIFNICIITGEAEEDE